MSEINQLPTSNHEVGMVTGAKEYNKRGPKSKIKSENKLSATLGFSCTHIFKSNFLKAISGAEVSTKLREIVGCWLEKQNRGIHE